MIVTGLIARSRLEAARTELKDLRTAVSNGDTATATRLVRDVRDRTESAAGLTSGPAWWVASNLPVVGSPVRTARTVAQQSDRLGQDVLPGVLRIATDLSAGGSSSSRIDLDLLTRAGPTLQRAVATAQDATATIASTGRSWLPFVASARDGVLRELQRLDGELTGADRAVRILTPMLGAHGPQRYFVGFLNEAEARGGGGIPGAFAIVTVDRGRISFDHFGSDDDLAHVRADVELGPQLDARYAGTDPTGTIQNSNLSPDFSVAGRIWAAMWEKKSGQHVDGALAVDPTALGYLLAVTGPATLPDGTSVSPANVVQLTQKTQYSLFPGTTAAAQTERKAYLNGVAKAIAKRLTTATASSRLLRALTRAAHERRLVVYSGTPAVETLLQKASWGGTLGNDKGRPYSGFVVNNAAGSKLDYYLRRTTTYRRTDCAAGGKAVATVALTNSAPRSGLPAYVTFRADTPPAGARPGDNLDLVTYYASKDATIGTVTVDGRPVTPVVQAEGDTVEVTVGVELPAGATRTVAVTVTEPAAHGQVQVLRQPLAKPLTVDLSGDHCG